MGILLPTLVIVWPLQNLSVLMLMKLGFPPESQRAVEMLLDARSRWALAYFVFFAVVIAPVAEEFVFRGMLFPLGRELGRPKLAWFGVSLLFALIHFDAAIFLPLFVLALLLTWLYQRTGCLLASVLLPLALQRRQPGATPSSWTSWAMARLCAAMERI